MGRVSNKIIILLALVTMLLSFSMGFILADQIFFSSTWTQQLPVMNAAGSFVMVSEYREVDNTTYANLMQFLQSDHTEDRLYVEPSYTCSDFAVALHNNAESQGIRCGIVNVQFAGQSVGHAFDVFPTTDKGLIYIDATGVNATQLGENISPSKAAVYLVNGSEFGEIALNQTEGNFSYAFYQDRMSKIDAYKAELSAWDANFSLFNKDFDAWKDAETDLYYKTKNYSADLKNCNDQLTSYNAQMDAYNAAVRQYSEGDDSVAIPPEPAGGDQLREWKNQLDAEHLDNINESKNLTQQGIILENEYGAYMATYKTLKSREEAGWIMYNPDDIVSGIDIYW